MACKISPEEQEKNKKLHAKLKENFDMECAEYWRRKKKQEKEEQRLLNLRLTLQWRVKSEDHAASWDSYSQKAVEVLAPPRNNISDSELTALLK